ncbi:MAG TPA: methyl-accepting chemotaxis protein [Stellaceae bacterium]|nr:methyl-accepting chemotaxis protein [Stellaceae bacterium]
MPRFDDFSLRLKMFLAPSFLLAALVGLAGYTLLLLNSNERHLSDLSDVAFERAALVAALDGRFNSVQAHLYRLTSVASNDTKVERKQALADALGKEMAGIETAFNAVRSATDRDAETAPLVAALAKTMKSYIDAGQQVVSMAAFDAATASIFMGNADQAYEDAQKQIDRLEEIVQKHKAEMVAQAHSEIASARLVYVVSLAVIALVAILATWLVSKRISRPVIVMAGFMRKLAAGERAAETPYTGRRDEIGAIAAAVQVFKETSIEADRLTAERERQREQQAKHSQRLSELARDFDAKVTAVLGSVTNAAEALKSTASIMAATAEETSRQAAAASAASGQAAGNVQTVAAATEQLASSVGEIGRQVGLSSRVTEKAVGEAGKTNVTVRSLTEASQRIGQVVELINSIASQTNLLALNATIEAARAGEAGKGFAVVASEVKNLANQTSKATEEIGSQIAGMQQATQQVVAAIDTITGTITEINKISATIAAAVEEQDAATQEIARNIQQAAAGTSEVSENIGGVNSAAGETGGAANRVLEAAGALSQQSTHLRTEVDRFLADVKAA